MSTNYVESSLKRFLKRKVKVTLGLIVAFMITGTVGFAETSLEKDINISIPEITADYSVNITTENSNIKITGTNEITISTKDLSDEVLENINNALLLGANASNPENINLDLTEDNGNFSKGFAYTNNTGDTFKAVNSNEVSVIEKENTQNKEIFVVDYGKNSIYYAGQHAENGGVIVNKGIIEVKKEDTSDATHMFGQSVFDGTAYNYGIIKNKHMMGQKVANTGIAYNYGIIANSEGYGQWTSNGKIFNYGLIANGGACGQCGFEARNYGIIINSSKGQTGAKDGKSYNYGLITGKTGCYGQYSEVSGSELHNFGLINIEKGNGQYAYNNGKLFNYGIINTKTGSGQDVRRASFSYNYGIITGKIYSMNSSSSYNYGVVYNPNSEGFYNYSGTDTEKAEEVINNGVAIVKNFSKGNEVINNGVVIVKTSGGNGVNSNNAINHGVEIDATTSNITISKVGDNILVATNQASDFITDENTFKGTLGEGQNLFADRYTKDKLVETVKITNDALTNNHITAVVGSDDTTDTVVLTKDGDLTLNNSSIVGYFEKNGTLLEVNGNLTLEGESVINAIAGNTYTGCANAVENVTAVKLADKKTLTVKDNSKVLGRVEGKAGVEFVNSQAEHFKGYDVDSISVLTTNEEPKTTNTAFADITITAGTIFDNSGKFIIDNQSNEKIKDKEISTSITLANNINIEKGIDGSSSAYGVELILGDGQNSTDGTIKIGTEENNLGIDLGAGDDTVIIRNKADIAGTVNTADGNDTVVLENLNGNHDTFDYKLANVENLDLNNQTWKIGNNAGFETAATIQNGTLRTDLTFDIDSDRAVFENSNAKDVLSNAQFGEKGNLQFGIGKGSELEVGAEYTVDYNKVNEDYVKVSAIFDKTGTDKLTVKDAEDIGVNSKYSILYNKMLDNAGNSEEILDILNNSDAATIAAAINKRGTLGETLATTGYKITRDISNSFMSAVNEWDKKANKGEWLANAKYINSDVEYDGANSVKGYDSDINSMIGMIEYGVSDRTAYGIALGGGETEVNVDGAGQLEGDNYYIGAYAKHSVNGFDLVGNLGYTISELEVNGEGSADSSAITLGAYVKRNIALTDTVRLEPNAAFTYDYIMQDNAEGSGVKVDNKDIHVFEAAAGMNIVKSFALEKGLFEMKAGVKYSMADVNRNEETVISTFGMDGVNLGSPDIDKARGTAHIGFDFEHTTGFGVNGKYETMWSDSGDDSRITAGISYRF